MSDTVDGNESAGILSLAQKLHDEYVSEGKAKAAEIVAEAERNADELRERLQNEVDEKLVNLESYKAKLEDSIKTLRAFEKAYREKLMALTVSAYDTLNVDAFEDEFEPVSDTESSNAVEAPVENHEVDAVHEVDALNDDVAILGDVER